MAVADHQGTPTPKTDDRRESIFVVNISFNPIDGSTQTCYHNPWIIYVVWVEHYFHRVLQTRGIHFPVDSERLVYVFFPPGQLLIQEKCCGKGHEHAGKLGFIFHCYQQKCN